MTGFVFLPSFYEAIKDLPDADRLGVYDALALYGLYGEVAGMSPVVKSLFALIKPVVDSSQRRYQAARANGNKPPKEGSNPRGRPRKNQTENQDKDMEKDKDMDMDMDSDMDKEKEYESEKESFSAPYSRPSEDEFEKMRQAAISKFEQRNK